MGFLAPVAVALQRRFYRRCTALVAPSESMAQVLRDERMSYDIGIWSRGVDRGTFNPERRDMAWRRSLGLGDDEYVVGFLSRLVMEKGLDVFCDAIDRLRAMGVPHRVLVVGEGPARDWFAARLPGAVFTGFLAGPDLGRAVASMDTMFFPSETEAFGNVSLEAMACAVPVVAAAATGSENLIDDGRSGRLITPGAVDQFADALRIYALDPALRVAHGEASELRCREYDWDRINQTVADNYIRLIEAQKKR